jgi:LydA holin phage, holin superfamily III
MDLNDKNNPFGYSIITYLWVIGLACGGGLVKYLNTPLKSWGIRLFIADIVSAGFMGLVTFWLCQWTNINGPLSAVLIATSGLMGNRATKELEYIYRIKFGMRYEEELAAVELTEASPIVEKALSQTDEK